MLGDRSPRSWRDVGTVAVTAEAWANGSSRFGHLISVGSILGYRPVQSLAGCF